MPQKQWQRRASPRKRIRANSDGAGTDEPPGVRPPGGEMAELVRRHDWANTPLGPLEHWSLALRMIARFMLGEALSNAAVLGPPVHPTAQRSLHPDPRRQAQGRSTRRAVFEVADESVGIAPELLPRTFERFMQANRTGSRSQGGLDIGLPDMTGYEVVRQIRASGCATPMKIVALTGYGQPGDHTPGEGFHAHLVKPVTPEDLHRILIDAPV